jgi:acetate kinase
MPDAVLALNAGSSSIKYTLFEIGAEPVRLAGGEIDGSGEAPLSDLLAFVDAHLGANRLVAVGHRVVHGGREHVSPVRLDDQVLAALQALAPLAPLHQAHSLSPVRAITALRPGLAQVACFDTAFHHTMPAVATRFALPRRYGEAGVRRYGFHGLSYEYIALRLLRTAPELACGRVITAHLGNGASLCAMAHGVSVDTTMGFTALDGLVMGTRCGTIDPGVILFMLQQQGLDAAAIEDLLYRRSGLLGVSDLSGDMRVLLADGGEAAREAIELFVYRIAREASALAGSLGGLDGLVFTAGIGEHVAEIRAAVCRRLAWLGLAIDPDANQAHAACISTPGSRVSVRVIPTDEEAMIAAHTIAVLAQSHALETA